MLGCEISNFNINKYPALKASLDRPYHQDKNVSGLYILDVKLSVLAYSILESKVESLWRLKFGATARP